MSLCASGRHRNDGLEPWCPCGPPITPTVHLNGTSREELLKQAVDAERSVHDAQRALAQAWPHGRDYYPQGPGALARAEAQFTEWQKQLGAMSDGLTALALRIDQAGRR